MSTDDLLMTTAEAARRLRVAPVTLEVWRCRGRDGPPYIRVGRLVRYRQSDLERWLNARVEQR